MRFRHWWYQLAGWVRRVCKSGLAGVSSYRREILNPVLYSGAEGFEESAGAFARAAVLKDGAARHEDLGQRTRRLRLCRDGRRRLLQCENSGHEIGEFARAAESFLATKG